MPITCDTATVLYECCEELPRLSLFILGYLYGSWILHLLVQESWDIPSLVPMTFCLVCKLHACTNEYTAIYISETHFNLIHTLKGK